jgi:16S rRNA (guanine527-N7)-methyltransferase
MWEGPAVDKATARDRLKQGAKALHVELKSDVAEALLLLSDELLRWNARVNLTAIRSPEEVLEKHLLDSLAVGQDLQGVESLLDIGSGGGFPGLVLKLQSPHMKLTLVDAVAKKVGFMKHAIAKLQLKGALAVHTRANGNPETEGLPLVDAVISRALMDLESWLSLAKIYTKKNGMVLAMLGQAPNEEEVAAIAGRTGAKRWFLRTYELPFSRASRAVGKFWFE